MIPGRRIHGYTMIDHEVHADAMLYARNHDAIRRAMALSQISEFVVQHMMPRVSLRWVLLKGAAF